MKLDSCQIIYTCVDVKIMYVFRFNVLFTRALETLIKGNWVILSMLLRHIQKRKQKLVNEQKSTQSHLLKYICAQSPTVDKRLVRMCKWEIEGRSQSTNIVYVAFWRAKEVYLQKKETNTIVEQESAKQISNIFDISIHNKNLRIVVCFNAHNTNTNRGIC